MLTATQLKYIALDKKKEQYKQFIEELNEVTEQLAQEMGVGGHFQDLNSGCVYQVHDHKGRFVHFEKYQIKRTRKEGERSGSLSLTDAKELGYAVK
jgi:hypothetical protein